jgi:hypothetical protein
VIEARDPMDGGVHLKGYLEGTALKSAGIYENGRRLRAFKVNDVGGQQRLDLDLGIGNPNANTVIRVTDADGRFAEAPVLTPDSAAARAPSTGDTVAPEVVTAPVEVLRGSGGGADTGVGVSAPDSSAAPADRGAADSSSPADSGPPSTVDDHSNTAEIPSHGKMLPSPSKRHTLASKLGNVQINILGVSQTQTLPATYDVVGQIAGRGITHAGIYVDGRLVQKIPITDSGSYTSFDQHFVMNGGAATIRAYGVGSQFIESSIDLNAGGAGVGSLASAMPAASGVAVQITSVRPVMANLYVVSGFITGRSLASAGLYQNGMLAQPIQLRSGIGSILGALTGSGQAVNFNVRFNPAMGTAVIRAFDTRGAYSEAPVMAGGGNPYGGYNPYAGGVSPYGGVTNPYGGVTNPYGGITNPYGAAAPPGEPPNPYYNPTSPYLPTRPTAPPSGPRW